MTYGIESLAAQRIAERHAEAEQARLAKTAATGTDHARTWNIRLPHLSLRRPAHSGHAS